MMALLSLTTNLGRALVPLNHIGSSFDCFIFTFGKHKKFLVLFLFTVWELIWVVSRPEGAIPCITMQIRPGMSLGCNMKFHGVLFLIKLFFYSLFIYLFLPHVLLFTVALHKCSY